MTHAEITVASVALTRHYQESLSKALRGTGYTADVSVDAKGRFVAYVDGGQSEVQHRAGRVLMLRALRGLTERRVGQMRRDGHLYWWRENAYDGTGIEMRSAFRWTERWE